MPGNRVMLCAALICAAWVQGCAAPQNESQQAAAAMPGTENADLAALPPKPVRDDWPDVAPLSPAALAAAFADPALQAAYPVADDLASWEKTAAAIKPVAERGNPVAQTVLAVMYIWGKGAWADYVNAELWYRRAAAQGYAPAQVGLGMLLNGRGQRLPNPDQAAHWFRLAASQGDILGRLELAQAYLQERGVPYDLMAMKLITESRSQPDPYGSYAAAVQLLGGYLGPRDELNGMRALHVAAEAGYWRAQLELARAYRDGSDLVYADATEAAHWRWRTGVSEINAAFGLPPVPEQP